MLSTILLFICALFLLVTVHELGHYLAAKLFGMRVDRFSIGFPPNLFSYRKGETEYVIGATPLGGYVKIAGMIDETMDTEFMSQEPAEDEFRSKPVWQRMIVMLAGVIFNVLLAVLIYTLVTFSYGEEVIPIRSVPGMYVEPGSLAADIGLQTGDRLIGINGEKVQTFNELFSPTSLTQRDVSFLVERNGVELSLSAPADFLDRINEEGFLDPSYVIPSVISSILPGSPAEAAGFEAGDRVISIDGNEVAYWNQLVSRIQSAEGELLIRVERGIQVLALEVTPDPADGKIGIAPPLPRDVFDIEQVDYSLPESAVFAVQKSGETMTGIVQGLGKMIRGEISVRNNLGGPVAIANVTREATENRGWLGFWEITAFLSITLAIMNMLPIPALDGGHVLFLAYEGITRREPSPKVRMGLQQIGFILLVFFDKFI
ncbi:MAG: RIP metalloprotease RseP [Balneolaceae bacterium]